MTKTRMNRDAAPRPTAGFRRRRLHLTALGVVVAAFALLLWARFLLVTGHPRTAYASPEAEAAPATASAQPADR